MPASSIDFDRLDELDDASEDDRTTVEWQQAARAPTVRARADHRGALGGAGLLLRLLRPWFDPRPGELRGLIIVLTGGLVLTSALWLDASRRPSGSDAQGFAAITSVSGEEDWGDPTRSSPSSTGATVAPAQVVVHVSGAVATPGLLVLAAGTRVGDAVLAAGGASPEARLDRLNLARLLEDGEQVHVPREGEEATVPAGAGTRGILADGRVDVNRASAEELATLPGIGPARAQAIIATREERPFAVPGDLRRVPGIGEATFQRLAPLVSVG